jgi:uncharacterized damage-inducible protein DinB
MSATETTGLTPAPYDLGTREQFLDAFEREHAVTLRVLRAFPPGHEELRPAERSGTAREVASTLLMEQGLAERALTTGFDWSSPSPPPPPGPDTLAGIADAFDQAHRRVAALVRGMSDEDLQETVSFPVAPKTMGDWPRLQFLWMMLMDQIHHRGQLSVYLRMAGGRVPSIYGPSADEPWL